MPFYEYQCQGCLNIFEKQRTISHRDDPLDCPSCNSSNVTRLLSRTAVFSSGKDGSTQSLSGGSSCAGCAGGSCASCSH